MSWPASAHDASIRHGLVVRAIRNGMVLSPPLVVTEAQIDEIVGKARNSPDETQRRFGARILGSPRPAHYRRWGQTTGTVSAMLTAPPSATPHRKPSSPQADPSQPPRNAAATESHAAAFQKARPR